MALAAREHRAAVVEVEMSGPQKLDADQPDIALAHDLLSKKAPVFAHLEEVLGDHTLTLAAKRSLLASWASDALGVEDSPSLRQLPSGTVVRVDDIMFGRPVVLTDEGRAKALQRLADGASISAVAREMKASRATIMRIRRASQSAA
jgi:Homeodomain-like domain